VLLVPEANASLFATEAGTLSMALPPGTQVAAGDVVARLVNSQFEEELARLTAHCEEVQLQREQLLILRVWNERLSRQLPAVEANLADAKSQLAQYKKRLERLVLRAPRAGQVLAPPHEGRSQPTQESTDLETLPEWSGSLLQPRNLGAWVELGTHILAIANPDRLEAWVAVAQADVAQVLPNQSVKFLLESNPNLVLEGRVVQVAQRATHPVVDPNSARRLIHPDSSYHLVQVQLQTEEFPLWVGARGQAKIETNVTTLAAMLARTLRATFQLPW
jgi:multidrug efflux pump subunit AcrA (membrane-fusion protein)